MGFASASASARRLVLQVLAAGSAALGKRAGVVSATLHLCLLGVSFAAHIATCPALVLSACRCISVAASGAACAGGQLTGGGAAAGAPSIRCCRCNLVAGSHCGSRFYLSVSLVLLLCLVREASAAACYVGALAVSDGAALLNFAIDQYCMFCDVNCAVHYNELSNCTHSIFAHRTLRRTWHPQNVVTIIIEDASRCVILRRTPRRWRPRTSFRVP